MNKYERIAQLEASIKRTEENAMWAWRGGEDHKPYLEKRRELIRELQQVKD